MKLLLIVLLLLVPTRLQPLDVRITVTDRSTEFTVLHQPAEVALQVTLVAASEHMVRISQELWDAGCSRQHRFIWRRLPPGEYVIEVLLHDAENKPVTKITRGLFVS